MFSVLCFHLRETRGKSYDMMKGLNNNGITLKASKFNVEIYNPVLWSQLPHLISVVVNHQQEPSYEASLFSYAVLEWRL